MSRFLAELRRRKVFHTAAVYAVVAAGVWGAANDALPALGLPEAAVTFVVVATLVGFPVALVLAWFFEVRPETGGRGVGAPAAGAQDDASAAAPARYRWRWVLGGTLGVLALSALLLQGPLRGAPVAEGARIVVAEFDASGESREIARAARNLLFTDLEHSPYLAVVPPLAISGAMRRMELGEEDALTSAVAREVAVRDGHTAVLEGDVASAGSGWLVSVRMVSASSGDVLLADAEALADADDVLPGIARLARRVREGAGESVESVDATPPLPELTTSSLPALLAMDRAKREHFAGRSRNSVPFLQEALELDPDFVMARARLATAAASNPARRREAGEGLAVVYPERWRLTDLERATLEWSYHEIVTGDQAAGARALEEYLDARPDAAPELQDLLALSAMFAGDWERAEALARPLLERSDGWRFNLNAILLMQGRREDFVPVDDWRFAARVAGMEERWDEAEALGTAARDQWNPAEPHLLDMIFGLARGQLARFDRGLRGLERPAPGFAAGYTVTLDGPTRLLLRGRPEEALQRVTAVTQAPPDGVSPALPLWVAEFYALVDSAEAARRYLDAYDRTTDTITKVGLRVDRAAAEGRVLLAEGRPEAALGVLKPLQGALGPWSTECSHCYLATLAEAYERIAMPDSAATTYEAYLATPWVFTDWRFLRLRRLGLVRERLATVYEELGRPEDAVPHYRKLVEDWADADAELQPRVEAAREALRRLGAEAGRDPGGSPGGAVDPGGDDGTGSGGPAP